MNEQTTLPPDLFQCELCGNIYRRGSTDEEANDEYKKHFGKDVVKEETGEVCNDCYQIVIKETLN